MRVRTGKKTLRSRTAGHYDLIRNAPSPMAADGMHRNDSCLCSLRLSGTMFSCDRFLAFAACDFPCAAGGTKVYNLQVSSLLDNSGRVTETATLCGMSELIEALRDGDLSAECGYPRSTSNTSEQQRMEDDVELKTEASERLAVLQCMRLYGQCETS